MRHRAVNSSRSMLYDMDAQRGTHRLVADIGVEDMAFVLDPRGIPRFALGSTDYDTYVLYQANDEGKDWQPAAANAVEGKFVPFALSPHGNEVFAAYSVNDGPVPLVRSDLAAPSPTPPATPQVRHLGEVG